MARKLVFTIAGVLSLLFGMAFLFLPYVSMSVYNSTLTIDTAFLTRYFGAWITGVGLLMLFAAPAKSTAEFVKSCVLGGLCIVLLCLIVAIWNIFETGNSSIWLNIAVYAPLTVGFLFLFFKKAD
jgi:hypothetical protein